MLKAKEDKKERNRQIQKKFDEIGQPGKIKMIINNGEVDTYEKELKEVVNNHI